MLRPSRSWILSLCLVGLVALPASGCGLAESIAENFIDDESVTIFARADRSGAILRAPDGTDIEAQPNLLYTGDAVGGAYVLCVLNIPLDPGVEPDQAEIDGGQLRFWVEPQTGDATELGPIIVSHLPDHPDQGLGVGQVPHPPGNDIATIDDVSSIGWRTIDAGPQLVQDWNAGRTASVYVIRMQIPSNDDAQADTLALESVDENDNPLRPHAILRFSLDL